MADTEKIKLVVEAEDNASDTLKNVKSNLSSLYRNISNLNYGLRQYNATMSSFNNMMINGVKELGSAIYDFTSDSIDNFSELSAQHAKTLGAMANDYDKTIESQQRFIENSEKLKQQAIDLAKYGINGNGSLATSVEVSAVQTELVKAGVSADTMLSTNVVKDVLQFAQANQLETSQAVEFAVALGNQFNVGYADWGDMLDKVSHTADMSVIDVADIVQSMKYAGGISAGLDRPMEETLGMIATLGNFGLRGSQAGSGIQAFLTRLLTGDTTVISAAMAEVAPPNALQAFYNFSNYAKSSGGGITYDDILNETFTENDITGQLRPMDEVVDALEATMESLNDEEQAWFAKKLFGLYQMKSAYALINGDDSGNMALQDVIKEIEENSGGTNANKLAELINSQSGQIQVTQNLIEGIKTELGQMLEPTTLSVLHEIQEFLKDPGNYDINWDSIRSALDESCDAIEEAYGSAIADAVRNLGNLTIDLGQVVEEIAPEFLEGMLNVFNSILEGDLFGEDSISGSWSTMISNMNASLEDLPPNLQKLGEKVVDVIDMFGKLATLNIATTIAQLVTSVLQIALMTVNAASVVINGTNLAGGTSVTGSAGTGGSGGKGSNGSGGSVIANNMTNIAGVMAGAYIGDKAGDKAGEMASDVAKGFGADEDTADIIGSGVDTAFKFGGMFGGLKLTKLLTSGKMASWLSTLGSKFALSNELLAFNLNTRLGLMGESALTGSTISAFGTLGFGGLLAGLALYDIYKDNHEMTQNQKQTGDIVRNGGQVGFDKDGNLIKDKDGNVMDITPNPVVITNEELYQYNAGEPSYMPAMPKKGIGNLWGLTGSYKSQMEAYNNAVERQKADEELFYRVQYNYEAVTGNKLDWFTYKSNKSEYDSNYGEITAELIESINSLNEAVNNMATGNPQDIDWAKVIPGFYAYSEQGQQQAIQNYLNNQIAITPSFTMEAPQIQVDVTIDSSGNVLSQKQAILNPGFNMTINNWYQKIASQNGSTTK